MAGRVLPGVRTVFAIYFSARSSKALVSFMPWRNLVARISYGPFIIPENSFTALPPEATVSLIRGEMICSML